MRFLLWVGCFTLLSTACGSDGDDAKPNDAVPLPDASVDDASLPVGDSGSLMPTSDASSAPDGAAPAVDGSSGRLRDGATDAGPVQRDASPGVPRPVDPGQISWRACAENTRDCGSMQVPLNYADPSAGTLRIAVMRRRASGERLGALLLNPGGPGSSAIDYLGFFVEDSASPLLDRFDLIAFDPRGVGYSARIDCHATLQALYAADPSPDDESEWKAIDDVSAKFAGDCQTAHGSLLPHVGTQNAARDMDQVRAALGETKLNYLGFSYGTSIGAHYAELFPGNVGTMVLDAGVDLELSMLDLTLEQARSFERALASYFGWCVGMAGRCNWTRGAAPAQAFSALASAIESQVIPAPLSDRPLGPGEFLTAVQATMYGGELGWRALSTGLDRALAGDGSTLMEYVDGYLQRDPDRTYSNRQETNYAVNCLDRKPLSVAEIRSLAGRFASEAPFFGVPSLTGLLVCAHWPVQGQTSPVPRGVGAPPLVVIGTLGDPATPYAWSRALADDLASAVLLSSANEGHTAYGRGDKCIDDAVHAYFFERTVPAENMCAASPLTRALFSRGPSARYRKRLR